MASPPSALTRRSPKPHQRQHHWRWALGVVTGLILLNFGSGLLADGFWFQEVGYLEVFGLRLWAQLGIGGIAFVISLSILLSNLSLAQRLSWGRSALRTDPSTPPARTPGLVSKRPMKAVTPTTGLPRPSSSPTPRSPAPLFGSMTLWSLLTVTFLLSTTIGILIIYHGRIAIQHWHPRLSLSQFPGVVPLKFQPEAIWHISQTLQQQPLGLGLLIGLGIALLIYPASLLRAIAVLMSIGFGVVLSEQWSRVLLFLNPIEFGQTDPLFNRDIGFYVFQLPMWELLSFWLVGVSILTLLSVGLVYLLSGDSLSQGKFPGFSMGQVRHLYGIGGCSMVSLALSYWLDRYDLLYSPTGVAYGASFTNVMAELPADSVLSIAASVFGLMLLWRSLFSPIREFRINPALWALRAQGQSSSPPQEPSFHSPLPLRPRAILISLGAYLAIAAFSSLLLPFLVQQLIVQPNELIREQPYIQHTIALTREAFDLDEIEVETFNPQPSLTYENIRENSLTINNVRLWDTRPLLETNRQLQRIRLYYEFPDADVDRYTIASPESSPNSPTDGGSEEFEAGRRQVLIAARELDYSALPDDAKTWVNEHLIYTHGYGFTMSPVNTAGDGGLPDYFIRGIEHIPSSEAVRRSIPVREPRIYYGEMTNTYVMTQTRVRELDYPSGSENEYNTYDGAGGINIGAYWRRLLFSRHLRDWQMLLSEDFTPETRLLFRRNIRDRVQAIAPFLRYDSDPYLVVADISQGRSDGSSAEAAASNRLLQRQPQSGPNHLYWIIDAYTTTSQYPYSDPLDNDFNYIRNSVKVVVDAYSGTTVFYVANPSDPIIQAWSRVFPNMFLPLDQMPEALHVHIRYPQDYYRVQSNQLMTYHMTDPQVFYNKEDQWRAPSEIYANEQQVVEPYYLIMRLPTASSEEFILLRPFTPAQRRNLIAWIAARSDGDRYGTQLLYTFPKQELVFGPEQIEARINQDPVISQQISLWNRTGSRAVQGNLLVIPIEESLLYVEPLYLQAEQNQLPTLVRVIVVFENRIAMAPTLDQALDAIFLSDEEGEGTTILRSVDEIGIPPLESEGVLESGDGFNEGTDGVEPNAGAGVEAEAGDAVE